MAFAFSPKALIGVVSLIIGAHFAFVANEAATVTKVSPDVILEISQPIKFESINVFYSADEIDGLYLWK